MRSRVQRGADDVSVRSGDVTPLAPPPFPSPPHTLPLAIDTLFDQFLFDQLKSLIWLIFDIIWRFNWFSEITLITFYEFAILRNNCKKKKKNCNFFWVFLGFFYTTREGTVWGLRHRCVSAGGRKCQLRDRSCVTSPWSISIAQSLRKSVKQRHAADWIIAAKRDSFP